MEEFIHQVEDVLRANFADAESELEEVASGERVGGFFISSDFVGVPQIDRQREIWRVLRANLKPDEQSQLSTILTLTPQEVAAMDNMDKTEELAA